MMMDANSLFVANFGKLLRADGMSSKLDEPHILPSEELAARS